MQGLHHLHPQSQVWKAVPICIAVRPDRTVNAGGVLHIACVSKRPSIHQVVIQYCKSMLDNDRLSHW